MEGQITLGQFREATKDLSDDLPITFTHLDSCECEGECNDDCDCETEDDACVDDHCSESINFTPNTLVIEIDENDKPVCVTLLSDIPPEMEGEYDLIDDPNKEL